MEKYEVVIGLEVHAQLSTNTKIFCSCSNAFGSGANENLCPVCCGMPGGLPVLNEEAVRRAILMGLAVGCKINPLSVFARKHYFYPDLPSGYQITQHEPPIAVGGKLSIQTSKGTREVRIHHIHMEADAGKSIHDGATSRIDLNRAATPLIEIVSEPDMRYAEEAAVYLRELRAILVHLGISDGNMEEGSFRCDANVSLRPVGQEEYGVRAELKNMNSFKNVQKALEYEIERHLDILEEGGTVLRETRLYDAEKDITLPMREKEEAHDYRYFPDPDLLPLRVSEELVEEIRAALPELPKAKHSRYVAKLGLSEADAAQIVAEPEVCVYFEAVTATGVDPKKAANWINGELTRECRQQGWKVADCKLSPLNLAELIRLVDDGTISGKMAKDIFPELCALGASPKDFVQKKGLVQISDAGALEETIEQTLADNPTEVASYRAGKTKLMGFFVGQVMKSTKGKANPALVNKLLAEKLGDPENN